MAAEGRVRSATRAVSSAPTVIIRIIWPRVAPTRRRRVNSRHGGERTGAVEHALGLGERVAGRAQYRLSHRQMQPGGDQEKPGGEGEQDERGECEGQCPGQGVDPSERAVLTCDAAGDADGRVPQGEREAAEADRVR